MPNPRSLCVSSRLPTRLTDAQTPSHGPPVSTLRSPKPQTHKPPRLRSTSIDRYTGSPTSSERSTLSPPLEPLDHCTRASDDALGYDPLDLLAAEIARTEGRALSPFDDPETDDDQLVDADAHVPGFGCAIGKKRSLANTSSVAPRKAQRLSDTGNRRR